MHEIQPLIDAVLLLLATVLVVPLCLHVKASPVLGYFVGGMVIGPHGFAFIANVEATQALAEFGVVFLLFTVGLELSLNRLKVMRRLVFGLGACQVIATGVAVGLAALWLIGDERQAVVIGGAFALSSTAIVIQLLRERHEFSTRSGRTIFAILLFQDLAVVPLIVLIPPLSVETGDGGAGSLGLALMDAGLRAVLAIGAILAVGHLFMKRLFHVAAMMRRSPELFTALVLLVVLAMSLATLEAGLSMALGGFLGGLLLSETEYRHQVEAAILPFSGLLLGLFFITVGMTIDVGLLVERWAEVLVLTVAVLAGKSVLIAGLARLFGIGWPRAVRVGLTLSQVGEFAFVLFALAMATQLLDPSTGQLLLMVAALTMVLTPFLTILGKVLADRMEPPEPAPSDSAADPEPEPAPAEDDDRPVLIAGFGRVGETVARQLREFRISYIALDNRAAQVRRGRDAGFDVFFGNCTDPDVLRAAGIDGASAVVCTVDDLEAAMLLIDWMDRSHPNMPIFARARNSRHRRLLRDRGVIDAVPETLESSLQLGISLLRHLGQKEDRIVEVAGSVREHGEELDQSHLADGAGNPPPTPAGKLAAISPATLWRSMGRLLRMGRRRTPDA